MNCRRGLALLLAGVVLALASGACGSERSPDPPAQDPLPSNTSQAPVSSSPVTTAPPKAPQTIALPDGIVWEDLESLAFELDGQSIQLASGTATITYGGASADVYTLQNRVAEGDLDGDGEEDLVVHIVENTAGTGTFHLIVPVFNNGGNATAGRPAWVGDRILMDTIKVSEGLVEVALYDRADDEPLTVITRRKLLEIDFAEPEPSVRVVEIEPIEDLPLSDPERPEIDIRFEPGAVSASLSDSVEFGQRQTYTLEAAAGQEFTATLSAPFGVWLDVRLGDEVIADAVERSQRVEATLPAAGPWRVTVLSTNARQTDYELIVEAFPLGTETPTTSTTTATVPPEPPTTTTESPPTVTVPPEDGSGPVVYLTFDDGPHFSYTPQVLDILARHSARATFFVLGALAENQPELIDRIVAEGHTVANHSWNHENLAGMPKAQFDSTIGRTQATLGDRGVPCMRPPYGSIDGFTRDWAASAGLAVTLWTVDTNDWRQPGTETIADRIVLGATDEAIVLMHDGGGNRSQTVQALEIALNRLSPQGLRFEPVCT